MSKSNPTVFATYGHVTHGAILYNKPTCPYFYHKKSQCDWSSHFRVEICALNQLDCGIRCRFHSSSHACFSYNSPLPQRQLCLYRLLLPTKKAEWAEKFYPASTSRAIHKRHSQYVGIFIPPLPSKSPIHATYQCYCLFSG